MPRKRRFYATFKNFCTVCATTASKTKNSKIPIKLSLEIFKDSFMYAKIRAKNWATLFEIDHSKESKIKSVAQFYFTLMRIPD